ncbi:putative mucin/carbohydrate-binding domain-containing protein [Bombilactobacillus thymidiniphilus]|uniref:Putative mucin/carbohydrate-binding domain-containing protein n=1 Tax=Bombilactobacillus thymidiniphilus TaxID=2923363 RepID=A0ABY4PD94_9LACO|nr:putative mucin/carbohydrate-binding domain-containing protein [Bombilactobacillus thymidiniphilus]UQS83681.1 hypothetical protein MOO47_00315 [Bombilactobacillus thymidiniphilus]
MPNGIYTASFSGPQMDNCVPDNNYIYVKDTDNNVTINLSKINYSSLTNQKIDFLGLGDDQFASLQTNLDKRQAAFNVTQTDPHAYYKGEVYAQVVVRDSSNNVKFETTLLGTDNPTGIYNIELNIGDTL